MSAVVSLQEVMRLRAESRAKSLTATVAEVSETPSRTASSPLPSKEDIHRAILMLDLAGQHVRLLVKKIADPPRRKIFEAQIETVEQLLQLARQLASNL
jgi:hypothetical protein